MKLRSRKGNNGRLIQVTVKDSEGVAAGKGHFVQGTFRSRSCFGPCRTALLNKCGERVVTQVKAVPRKITPKVKVSREGPLPM